MLGSLAVLAGLLAVDAGFHQGDAIAALLVAAIILLAALRLLAENANVLMDRSPEEARAIAERAIARARRRHRAAAACACASPPGATSPTSSSACRPGRR